MKFETSQGIQDGFCKRFLMDLIYYGNAFDYTKAIIEYNTIYVMDSYDELFNSLESRDVSRFYFEPNTYSISFGDEKYVIINDGELSYDSEKVLDAMFAFAKNSHMFDFFQDNVIVCLYGNKDLVINFERKA